MEDEKYYCFTCPECGEKICFYDESFVNLTEFNGRLIDCPHCGTMLRVDHGRFILATDEFEEEYRYFYERDNDYE